MKKAVGRRERRRNERGERREERGEMGVGVEYFLLGEVEKSWRVEGKRSFGI